MKAAPLTSRPDFQLMKQSDIQSFYHLQMPRWLFSDPNYKTLSLEAKVAYTFLLNRFQLSRLNGWVNDGGEVFIIFTRVSLAEEMQVSYHKIIEAMKELSAARLIWEKRCGRGAANQIYLARVEHTASTANTTSAPFVDAGSEAGGGPVEAEPPEPQMAEGARSSDTELLGTSCVKAGPTLPALRGGISARQEVRKPHFKTCQNSTSASTDPAGQEVRNLHPNNTDVSPTDGIHTEVSPSVGTCARGVPPNSPWTEDDGAAELEEILEQCHLELFPPETATAFEGAVERLYYSRELPLGRAVLPQCRIRSHLHELDFTLLQAVEGKLRQVQSCNVKSSMAYIMTVIFNTIAESKGDLLVDPYLNSLRDPPFPGGGGGPCS